MPFLRRSRMLTLSAAGFIATRTSGASPGVKISSDEKLIWKPETPGSVPAGARISAGKSGKVARSFPATAVVAVNCVPVSCIPSPESPAKRITTRSRVSTFEGFATVGASMASLPVWGTGREKMAQKPPEFQPGSERSLVGLGHAADEPGQAALHGLGVGGAGLEGQVRLEVGHGGARPPEVGQEEPAVADLLRVVGARDQDPLHDGERPRVVLAGEVDPLQVEEQADQHHPRRRALEDVAAEERGASGRAHDEVPAVLLGDHVPAVIGVDHERAALLLDADDEVAGK